MNASNRQEAYPDSEPFFGATNEKENNKVKESLRNHSDVFMDKVKVLFIILNLVLIYSVQR